MREVICVSIRESMPTQIIEGETYYLDFNSDKIYSDRDGDWYVPVYDKDRHYIGDMNLKHFRDI